METLEALPAQPLPVEDVSNATSLPEEDPKAALDKGVALEDENEDQILFSCNICYDVSSFGGKTHSLPCTRPAVPSIVHK
jgi:hypothetical protein